MSAFYNVDQPPFNMGSTARAIAAANNGLLFDIGDMSTMFQDAAGTTPVTAVEQPVGLILDKSGNGNHATQPVTASRPTLSARYNLLTKTEDFSDAVWQKQASGTGTVPIITTNYAAAPDGSMTATRIKYALNGGTTSTDFSMVYQAVTLPADTQTILGVWLKSTDGQTKNISVSMTGSDQLTVAVGIDWTFVSNAMIRSDNNYLLRFELRGIYNNSDSADILIWHPDLRLGTTTYSYQRVNTSTDYDTNPALFPKYLKFDGIDDYLNLPYMGLYTNGSASVITSGALNLGITAQSVITESNETSTTPVYNLIRQHPLGVEFGYADTFIRNDSDTALLDTVGTYSLADSVGRVFPVVDTGSRVTRYRNSKEPDSNFYTRSGSMSLTKTTLGALIRTTTSDYVSMKLYGLIVTKSALTNAQRVRCERFLARKAGVML